MLLSTVKGGSDRHLLENHSQKVLPLSGEPSRQTNIGSIKTATDIKRVENPEEIEKPIIQTKKVIRRHQAQPVAASQNDKDVDLAKKRKQDALDKKFLRLRQNHVLRMKTPKENQLNAVTLNWEQYKSKKQENDQNKKDGNKKPAQNEIIAEAEEEEKQNNVGQ